MNAPDVSEKPSHNKLFKTLFRRFFKDLVELVHPRLARVLDLEEPEFIDVPGFADLRKHGHVVPDLVAKTGTRSGEERLVLAHVETEGRFRSTMDARMERYYMQLTLEYDCPVVSIAVFLRGGPAGIERRQVVRAVGPWIGSRVNYLAFGLSGSLAEEYVDRPQPLAASLAALMRSEAWGKMEQTLHCLRAVRRAEVRDEERYLLAGVVLNYVNLSEVEQEGLRGELEKEANKEVREMVLTWDEAIAESEARGRAVGLVEGRAEGQRQATREAIVLLLKRRGTPVSAEVLAKLESIDDLSRLHEIFERALEARSPADVGL